MTSEEEYPELHGKPPHPTVHELAEAVQSRTPIAVEGRLYTLEHLVADLRARVMNLEIQLHLLNNK